MGRFVTFNRFDKVGLPGKETFEQSVKGDEECLHEEGASWLREYRESFGLSSMSMETRREKRSNRTL